MEEEAAVDIPDLGKHKRDKEKKRSGVFWSWGGGGQGVSLFTLLGGDGDLAAARAYEELGRLVSEGLRGVTGASAAARGAPPGALGGLGKTLFFAVALLSGMLGGFFVWLHRHHGASAAASYDLGGISASVRPHPQQDSVRLRFAGESAGGAINWDGKAPKDAGGPKFQKGPEETKGPDEVEKPKETDWNEVLGQAGQMDGAPDPLQGPKLTAGANLSTALGGRFGDSNVFASNKPALYQPKKLSGPKKVIASATRALTKFPATARHYALKGSQRFRQAFSPLAFAQLRLTNALSGQAATMATTTNVDTAKSLAADAFDQGVTAGTTLGNPSAGSVALGGAGAGYSNPKPVAPMGPGAPDLTQPPGTTPVNMTPYQSALDQIMQMIQQAAMLKMMGMLMIAIGLGLIATGWPPTVIAGIALVLAGVMMIMQAMQLAAAAQKMGQQIVQAMQGQQIQSQIVDQCAQQAAGSGTSLSNCQHSSAPSMSTNISQATDKERSGTWTWDSESGNSNSNANNNASSPKKK